MSPLRVLVVDDHPLFRQGLAALLATRPQVEVVGEAGDGLEAQMLAQRLRPDVILMDVRMPRCSGLEAVRAIKSLLPGVHILMLTVSDRDQDLFDAIKGGAEGYLLKNVGLEELMAALEGVRRGEAALPGSMASSLLRELRAAGRGRAGGPGAPDELTGREVAVLRLVANGATNQEIAASLGINEKTVKAHLSSILAKLHLRNRVQAATYAVRAGLAGGTASTLSTGRE
jgi:DNA-binding NarL/FixJ family response regulator